MHQGTRSRHGYNIGNSGPGPCREQITPGYANTKALNNPKVDVCSEAPDGLGQKLPVHSFGSRLPQAR